MSIFCVPAFSQQFTEGFDPAQDKTEAAAAIQAWLGIVDNGQYSESWDNAAFYLKSTTGKKAFEKSIEALRTPLGKVVSREIKSNTYARNLSGFPDGAYVIIQYDTEFKNKKTSVETVTTMREEDGAWRVCAYTVN